jgi:conserved oligomeric Golgi complex subunit 5
VHNIAVRLRSLDSAIRDLVTKHQEELLHQAGQTAELKQSVIGIDACADRLAKAAGRVKRDLIQPFEELKKHVTLLERLQSASDLLRRVTRVTANIRKLKAVLHRPAAGVETSAGYDFSALAAFDSRELGKAAQILYDIEQYTSDDASAQLREVDAIKSELPWLGDAGKAIRSRATVLLFKGMDTLNQAELGAALQV